MQYVLTSTFDDGEQIASTPVSFEEALEAFFLTTGDSPAIKQGDSASSASLHDEAEKITMAPSAESNVYWIDQRVEELSDESLRLAYDRAEHEFGGIVADTDSDEFKAEFNKQLMLIVAKHDLEGLTEEGLIEPSHVTEGGHTAYQQAA